MSVLIILLFDTNGRFNLMKYICLCRKEIVIYDQVILVEEEEEEVLCNKRMMKVVI